MAFLCCFVALSALRDFVACSLLTCVFQHFLRKEVIQPQLPLLLPCYDFVPVTSPAFSGCLLAVSSPISGVTSSHDVTGGVYKARERIHRTMADARLLATPASCRRVAACNPNYDRLWGIGCTSPLRVPLYRPL
jgi:hypothetical protein